jgi:hypothetical protein
MMDFITEKGTYLPDRVMQDAVREIVTSVKRQGALVLLSAGISLICIVFGMLWELVARVAEWLALRQIDKNIEKIRQKKKKGRL